MINKTRYSIYDNDTRKRAKRAITKSWGIPCCWGVIAFVHTLEKCREELLSVLEDRILVGLRGHPLPVVGRIKTNKVEGGIDKNGIQMDKI